MPKPRWMPLPKLLYAQVVKKMRRRRIVAVQHRVVLGTQGAVDQVLRACGWLINTAFVERLNLSLRQRVATIWRRSATSCKSEDGLSHQLALFQVYYNFVLPHASLWTWPHHCGHIWERVVPHLPFWSLEFRGITRPNFVLPQVIYSF